MLNWNRIDLVRNVVDRKDTRSLLLPREQDAITTTDTSRRIARVVIGNVVRDCFVKNLYSLQ